MQDYFFYKELNFFYKSSIHLVLSYINKYLHTHADENSCYSSGIVPVRVKVLKFFAATSLER